MCSRHLNNCPRLPDEEMGLREGHTCSRSHSESMTELGLEAQLRMTPNLPCTSCRVLTLTLTTTTADVWNSGKEKTGRRRSELGPGCICQNQIVTSFMQRIRTIRIVSGPLWGLSFSLCTRCLCIDGSQEFVDSGLYNFPSRQAKLATTFWSILAYHVWLQFGALAQPRRQSCDRWALPGGLSLAEAYCEIYHNPSSPPPTIL